MLNFSNNNLNNGGRIRTVLDVGCGVASFGAYLLSSDIIAMSVAPNDVHQNQIQFALERGIPAYLGVLGTKRLPYPSRSFELAHCSRCRIDWLQRDGILLLELDRLLRPGGYFAYSSPEAYAQDEEDLRIWREMSALVERMCWKIAAKQNQTVIWVKPLTNDCYMEREAGTQPPLCRSDDDPDAVYGVKMEACITPYSDQTQRIRGSGLAPWPSRLTSPPPRLTDFGYSIDMFEKDTEVWQRRVENYWNLLKPKIKADTLRNIMDMKANFGSFAAALKDKDVWVMNVVPEDGPNTLKLIYDRGLLGSVHNWCEAYSTYPRTYDLLHAWTVFSDMEKKGCSGEDLLIEMDRMLRPTGFVIVRDKRPVMEFIKKHLTALHWEAIATADADSGSEQDDNEIVFVIQKKMWLATETLRDSEVKTFVVLCYAASILFTSIKENSLTFSDTLIALRIMHAQFPKLEKASIQPFILRSQLYSSVNDRTRVDRDLESLKKEKVLRTFKLYTGQDDDAIMFMEDYLNQIESVEKRIKEKRKDETAVFVWFKSYVIVSKLDPSIEHQELCSLLSLGGKVKDEHVSLLINAGLLTRQLIDPNMYWFAIPNIGSVLKGLSQGRKELMSFLNRRKFKEMMLALLEKKRLRMSPLDMRFHLRDLIGSGKLKTLQTPAGLMVQVSKD
ncbi:Serine/threonine-protein kinase [Thalictrum thalictroides]|uniref:Methyltransferase n=1 Tax=Thalictrum thalictroides TaxID=46969 RepID=A0A7J6VCG0_THATH|nr:Serine/threonine-protein kinase [Thalictrum thalictroides]